MRGVLILLVIPFFVKTAYGGENISLSFPEQTIKRSGQQDEGGRLSRRDRENSLIGFTPNNVWRIQPGFEFKTIYDSNINREPPHERDEEIILSSIPSIGVVRRGNKFDLKSEYEASIEKFLRDDKQSHINHMFKNKIGYTTHKLKVKLDESMSYQSAYAASEQSERRTYITNNFSPEIAYRITPKVSLAALYQNYWLFYKESVLRESSYYVDDIGGRVYYHAKPKLDFYLHSSAQKTTYYNSDKLNSSGYSILFGSQGRVTRKVIGTVQTGFRHTQYEDKTISAFNSWVLEGIVQYNLTAKVIINLMAKRDRQESVYQNTGWYQSDMIGTRITYNMSKRTGIELDQIIQKNRYSAPTEEEVLDTPKRRVDYFTSSALRIIWKPIRHVMIKIGYTLNRRDGNVDNVYDYVSHSLDGSIAYKF